ncbi:MAG: transglutaminase-like domain-containing protein [Thermodesulfobacteriota bacterium]
MSRKTGFIILCLMLAAVPAMAETLLLNGGQQTAIRLHIAQSIGIPETAQKLALNFIQPVNFSSPTYNQTVEKFYVNYSTAPDREEKRTDAHGNDIIEAVWEKPPPKLIATIDLAVNTGVRLEPLTTAAPFPVGEPAPDIVPYLAATAQAPSNNPEIQAKARELTAGAASQFDAVQRILSWVVDNVRYAQLPDQHDALSALRTGKGNCQSFSRLSAALMRAVGIPVRIVTGVTLKQPYEIRLASGGTLVMKNAQGRYAWIEVWFPDLNWMPFDPQGTEMFVGSRFIRMAVGLDCGDAEKHGLIQWSEIKTPPDKQSQDEPPGKRSQEGVPGKLSYTEDISAEFVSDSVKISGRAGGYGPRQRLLCPEVSAEFQKTPLAAGEPEPVQLTAEQMQRLSYVKPFLTGNLEFPEHHDFTDPREPVRQVADGAMETARSFLAETAEYVTAQGNKYAQSFILTEPVKAKNIGLALRNFSADGQIWAELFSDNNGLPDQRLAVSDSLPASGIDRGPGYHWVDFVFGGQDIALSPGRYWLALGFSGGPIINWFFTYGKPSGLMDGTRLQTLFDKNWGHRLAFEFNYRIQGMGTDKPIDK